MKARGRTLKFTAVIALVALALTGFSTGRHHSSRHGSGGGGGGCSSSRQDHDSSSSSTSGGGSYDSSYDDDDDDSYSSGGSSSGGGGYTRRPTNRSTPSSSSTGSGEALEDGTVRLVSCATKEKPYATVEVGNPNGRQVKYWVDVTFEDAQGIAVAQKQASVKVSARGKATVRVPLYSSLIDEVDHCEVAPEAYGS
ncbi:hypothetical protein SAMN06272735_3704 [Streptomyces sp. TLI_55]|uniref:hypothetical protein n=1 Tax=Streptomyces sp. TLI_55 TaxID=1938861 RepID=UPI000BD12F8A|nr:hypothetical protein [Streptomyces sp. TLI_55]SNX61953.1 hypothetical protein SAMN06272735_3704 [Streptomyces sp. TLI_55]